MAEFQPFLMERMMSKFEQAVEYNLSESGVHPVLLSELLADDPGHIQRLLDTDLNYAHVNGIPELRENIASMYEGATSENVFVTVGAIEANYIATLSLLSDGGEMAIMLPNYMQIWGVVKNHGIAMTTFSLKEENGWALHMDELVEAVTPRTKVIAICNPNNPTGYVLTDAEMDGIVGVADKAGVWILADEVYRGAERTTDEISPSFYGKYDKVIATGSLSKAYGLPGLRLGWAVAPTDIIDAMWSRHEYLTLSATMLSNKLAAIALSPTVRPRLIGRARDYIRKGYPVLKEWMDRHENTFSYTPPQASAITFVRYHLDVNSTHFSERLCREKSVFIVPGDHFGIDHHVRISFGLPHDILLPALDRIHEMIVDLQG